MFNTTIHACTVHNVFSHYWHHTYASEVHTKNYLNLIIGSKVEEGTDGITSNIFDQRTHQGKRHL